MNTNKLILIFASTLFLLLPLQAFAQTTLATSANGLGISYEKIPATYHEATLLELTNRERLLAGLQPLAQDENLAIAARNHAKEMSTLKYLSHESPTPANHTLQQRIINAGSIALTIGENIAQLSHERLVVTETVKGWMNSPGHRANLLSQDYNSVGFGVAISESGVAYIVQNFGGQPIKLIQTGVQQSYQEQFQVTAVINSKKAQTVALFYSEDSRAIEERVTAGISALRFTLNNQSRVQLRLGAETNDALNYILQDDGWLDPVNNTWSAADFAPRLDAQFENVEVSREQVKMLDLTFSFDKAPQQDYLVWVNGEIIEDATFRDNNLYVTIENSASPLLSAPNVAHLELGLKESGTYYDIVMRLELTNTNGRYQFVPSFKDLK